MRVFAEIVQNTPNPFIPVFLKWTLPSLNLNTSISTNRGFSLKLKKKKKKKKKNRMANRIDHDELTHLDLHCLQRRLFSL